ncbi:MAG: hypothetical protein JW955_22840 [Sedimentisphaerales bacterium]|nr:hypothetical protein [Sedimentisphaerales bacterium]
MSERKKLTKRQCALLDGLFVSDADEKEVLSTCGVPRALYEKWLADERFTSQFDQRIAREYRKSHMILARSAPDAAQKLVELAREGKGETTRKACLDIISFQPPMVSKGASGKEPIPETPTPATSLPPETASRLLAVLAGQA